MKIAVDARAIEGNNQGRGVGRILYNILKVWSQDTQIKQSGTEFYLYFKHSIPQADFLNSSLFKKRVLGPILGKESNALFEHILLPKALKDDKVSLLYAPAYTAPLLCPVPFVVVIHDISYEVHPEWFSGSEQILRRFISKRSARRAVKTITVSDFTRSEVIKYYNLPKEKIVRVYQPAVSREFLSAPEDNSKVPTNPYALFIGTFFNRRHLPELIKAVEIVNQDTDFDLVLVGNDKTYPEQNIEKCIVAANQRIDRLAVYHHDSISDNQLASLYTRASSVCLLSEYEGFGMPLLEGMSFGVPVVIAPDSSLEEVAGGAAYISSPHNPHKIAQDLLKLKNDAELRSDLVEKGLERSKFFNWEKSARETLKILTGAQQSN